MSIATNLVKAIGEFEPEDGNWLGLDDLLNKLWKTGEQEKFTRELLGLLNRQPSHLGLKDCQQRRQ